MSALQLFLPVLGLFVHDLGPEAGQSLIAGQPRNIATLEGRYSGIAASIAFSPDGKTLAAGYGGKLIKLWDVATGKEKRTLKGHTRPLRFVTFSPDGKTLASAAQEGTIRLWDVATGKNTANLIGHSHFVNCVAFSPDGKFLVSGGSDGIGRTEYGNPKTIKLWDLARGQAKNTFGVDTQTFAVAFSPDGKTLISGGAGVTVWEAQSSKETARLDAAVNHVHAVAFSPDGALVASTSSNDRTIKLWDVAGRKQIAVLKGHTGVIYAVAFSPDGKRLASASDDETIGLWDVAGAKNMATLKGHRNMVFSVAFSPDGKTLASASADGTIKLWDVSK